MSAQFNPEKIKKSIASILDRIQNETDPELLADYRKMLKGTVPLFKRSWTAAWLLMSYDQETHGDRGKRFGTASATAPAESSGENRRAPPLPEAESKRLFISIGRNRRMYPREILGLLAGKAGMERDDIGAIHILDNYSFVQVRDTAAEKAIAALNGIMFRGRTLTVNYAKSKKDQSEQENAEDENAEADSAEEGEAADSFGGEPTLNIFFVITIIRLL